MLYFLPNTPEMTKGPLLLLPWAVWRPLAAEARELERELWQLPRLPVSLAERQRADLALTRHLASVLRVTLDGLPRRGQDWGRQRKPRLAPTEWVVMFVGILARHTPQVDLSDVPPDVARQWADALDRAERVVAALRACAPPVSDLGLATLVLDRAALEQDRLVPG